MGEKNTKELIDILGKTHLSDFDTYCKDNKTSMNVSQDSFSIYIKDLLIYLVKYKANRYWMKI